MVTITVSNEDSAKIQQGDTKALRKVIEAESIKSQTKLLEITKVDDFRFYQGVAQTYAGLLKLLP